MQSAMVPDNIIQKYRNYYSNILRLGGEKTLRETLSQERQLSLRLPKLEKTKFLSVINQMERELLHTPSVPKASPPKKSEM